MLEMEEEFKRLETENKWDEHYEMLLKKSRTHSSNVGDNSSNQVLNRYLDVKPYDRSRIKLLGLDETDYINANFVTVPKAGRQYILTQGPLPDTVSHFWLMVWEQKSNVIVMLNKLIEMENFKKCEQYWPNSIDDVLYYDDVNIEVTLKSIKNLNHYCIREMLLMEKLTNKSRTIHQIHYTAWPDHGQPSSPTSFLRLLSAVRKLGGLDKMEEPAVIHCSAGIGRSGTFCLIDSILTMVENQGTTEGIDIVNILLDMRDYRKGLIQSPVQLRFSYMTIIYGIKILERANKLQPHISSIKDSKSLDTASQQLKTNGSTQHNGKKTRRGRKKQTNSSASNTLNLFKKEHKLVEALDDIDSDSADKLVYLTTTLPTFKKAKSSSISEELNNEHSKQQPPDLTLNLPNGIQPNLPNSSPLASATTKAQMLTNAMNSLLADNTISTNNPSSSTCSLISSPSVPETNDSVLLRRRERELKNLKLAEKTMDIKNKMKAADLKRERHIKRMAILKKSAVVGGVVAVVLSSVLYIYLHDHSSS